MRRALFSTFVCLAASTSLSWAEGTGEFYLSMPIGYGDARSSKLCGKATEHANSGCVLSTIVDPGTDAIVTLTVLQSLGSLDELNQRFSGDFVPWPWSSTNPDTLLTPEDFGDGSVVPVLQNPCSLMLCAPDRSCVWNPEQPWSPAVCEDTSAASVSPLTWMHVPLGQVSSISPLALDGATAAQENETEPVNERRPDVPMCGPLKPGQMCMGNYIKDEDGRIWQIP